MENRFKWTFLSLAVVLLAVILYFGGFFGSNTPGVSSDVDATSIPSQITKDGITATGGDFTVEQMDEPEGQGVTRPVPNIEKPVKYSSDLSVDAKKILAEKIAVLVTRLNGNPSSYTDWFELGLAYKMAGDFVAAKDAWEYSAFLYDKDAVVYANLGDLYGYYLKNNGMAEINFLKAIELEPMIANTYLKTADFYREVALNPEKAASVLARGLAELPNDPALKAALEKLSE